MLYATWAIGRHHRTQASAGGVHGGRQRQRHDNPPGTGTRLGQGAQQEQERKRHIPQHVRARPDLDESTKQAHHRAKAGLEIFGIRERSGAVDGYQDEARGEGPADRNSHHLRRPAASPPTPGSDRRRTGWQRPGALARRYRRRRTPGDPLEDPNGDTDRALLRAPRLDPAAEDALRASCSGSRNPLGADPKCWPGIHEWPAHGEATSIPSAARCRPHPAHRRGLRQSGHVSGDCPVRACRDEAGSVDGGIRAAGACSRSRRCCP